MNSSSCDFLVQLDWDGKIILVDAELQQYVRREIE